MWEFAATLRSTERANVQSETGSPHRCVVLISQRARDGGNSNRKSYSDSERCAVSLLQLNFPSKFRKLTVLSPVDIIHFYSYELTLLTFSHYSITCTALPIHRHDVLSSVSDAMWLMVNGGAIIVLLTYCLGARTSLKACVNYSADTSISHWPGTAPPHRHAARCTGRPGQGLIRHARQTQLGARWPTPAA